MALSNQYVQLHAARTPCNVTVTSLCLCSDKVVVKWNIEYIEQGKLGSSLPPRSFLCVKYEAALTFRKVLHVTPKDSANVLLPSFSAFLGVDNHLEGVPFHRLREQSPARLNAKGTWCLGSSCAAGCDCQH